MNSGGPGEPLSPMKRALIELRELRGEVNRLQGAAREPIAVTGIGCRFPGGVVDAASFWRLLSTGSDAIGEVPPDRWDVGAYYDADPTVAGKAYTRHGGFLADVRGFDARFFGVSPREAASLDPQHRLLLEVAWEALEDAATPPHAVAAGEGGVFIGISNADYAHLHTRAGDATRIDTYEGMGNAFSFASGRLAYLFGWHGPSISVDTACSAALVAVHLACQSLRAGECRVALAGGVNLIVNPDSFVRACKSRMLSRDGRCKTFDAAADGYGRGEGAGILVLKRLSDAVAAGDRILAVLRGSAVNQDGRTSGLTVPNGLAQQALIRQALVNAGVSAADITYVEAHGTGTALGDPIEVAALAAVFSGNRPAGEPLLLGSVKSNIGHLESAAGIAGLIKAILALQHREVPPHLNFVTPTPHVPWNDIAIRVPTVPTPWSTSRPSRLAGVSSFGFSGTNAHVIVEEAPAPRPPDPATEERPRHVLGLSGKSAHALGELVDRYIDHLGGTGDEPVADVCFTAAAGRVHFAHRLAVVGTSIGELREALAAWRAGRPSSAVMSGTALPDVRPEVAFLFTGQGAQYPGMGRMLYETQPVFRRAIDRCAEVLKSHLPVALHDVLYGEESDRLDQTAYTQPALVAVEWALSELWRAWGIEPALVIGHSVGEYAAACVAGVLDIEDALRLVAARGRLMQALPEAGVMAAVFAGAARVSAALANHPGVEIAGLNGASNIVVSGTAEAVGALLQSLESDGIHTQRLRTSHAFHSALVEPMLDEFRRIASNVAYHPARLPLLSNVSGEELVDTATAEYWTRHARQPVQFWPALQRAVADGCRVFVEIGPHPVLLALGRQDAVESALWLPSLRRDRDDWSQITETVASLYVHGVPVDWNGFDREYSRRRVSLPTYPWQRENHWLEHDPAPADNADARWQAAVAAARTQASEAPFDLELRRYPVRWSALDRLSTAYIVRACRELRLFEWAGERHTIASLLESRGIAATYRHLVSRWLHRLAAVGWLREEPGGAFSAIQALPDPEVAEALREAREALDDLPPVLQYVEDCGEALTQVLTGVRSPLDTLFPDGSFARAEALYEHWALSRFFSGIARAAVASLAGHGRRIRIVEIGAGTGGTTAAVVPALPADRATYWYTDVSTAFLGRARQKFAAHPFVRYGLLDIERDPGDQGFPPESFDAVVATNVLHATRDLAATLDRVRSLLVPGGVLVLCEATTHFAWFDVTTGLIEGWQRFEDEQRGDVPLLPPTEWERLLLSAGFEAVASLPEPGSPAEVLGQHVILARTAGDVGAASVASAMADREQAAAVVAPAPAGAVVEDGVVDRLLAALASERLEIMVRFVAEQVAAVLRCPPDSIDVRHPLMDVGVDSLMAVELRSRLGVGLALREALPATLVFEQPTAEAIARLLLATLFPDPAGVEASEEVAPASERRAAIGHLSDDEVTALLMKKLESL